MPVVIAEVVETPLDLQQHLAAVDNPRQGATASFVGMVRNHDPEATGEVVQLDYTAHPSAPDIIRTIAEQTAARLDPQGEALVAIIHRIGHLSVGDVAIVAAISSPHRALAFTLCAELVEEVKRSLPIWKLQRTTDGDEAWSGLTG